MKLITLATLLGVVGLVACTPQPAVTPSPSPEVQGMSASPSPEAMVEASDSAVTAVDGVVPVNGLNFSYDVKEIRAKKGDKLTVAFTNTEGFHDFKIDELDIDSGMVKQGDTMEIEIPTDQPGTYEFYCSVGEHRANGMWGRLIIE